MNFILKSDPVTIYYLFELSNTILIQLGIYMSDIHRKYLSNKYRGKYDDYIIFCDNNFYDLDSFSSFLGISKESATELINNYYFGYTKDNNFVYLNNLCELDFLISYQDCPEKYLIHKEDLFYIDTELFRTSEIDSLTSIIEGKEFRKNIINRFRELNLYEILELFRSDKINKKDLQSF